MDGDLFGARYPKNRLRVLPTSGQLDQPSNELSCNNINIQTKMNQRAKKIYYGEARDRTAGYHKAKESQEWLEWFVELEIVPVYSDPGIPWTTPSKRGRIGK